MNKEINLDEPLLSIINRYPDLLDILYELGFTQIKMPGMLQTAGRFMTLRNGCELRKIDLKLLIDKLKMYDYKVIRS